MEEKERQIHFDDRFKEPEVFQQQLNKERFPLAILLDGINNPRNIGMIFRLAEAARIQCIYSTPGTDFSTNKKLIKASRSTNKYIPFYQLSSLEEVVELKEKYELTGLEITTKSIPYHQYRPHRPVLLVPGNEQYGLSKEILALTDQCIHIPMFGVKTSMNVSVATGIAVYGILGQMNLLDLN